MKLWMCSLVLLVPAAALDMTGKIFIFPKETNTAHVQLYSVNDQSFSALTVCHRSFTDLKRDHSLFSLATKAHPNEFLIYYDSSKKQFYTYISEAFVLYQGLDYVPNKWHAICTTWSSKTGLVQLWFNGTPMMKKLVGTKIDGKPIIILGQEQDKYGSAFDKGQSFVGMMTDVHVWNREITPCEIQMYSAELSFPPGNVVNWAALDFQMSGNVFIEEKQKTCCSACKLV